MAKTLMENIESFIDVKNKDIEFKNSNSKFNITINEHVDLDKIHDAIEMIVANVVEQNFAYDLIDILFSYHMINLFTNIPVPMQKDETDIPDYKKCFDISLGLNLKHRLFEESHTVGEYIKMIEVNVWRKLEYKKAMRENDAFAFVCDKAYDLLEFVNDAITKANTDVDPKTLASGLGQLSLVKK